MYFPEFRVAAVNPTDPDRASFIRTRMLAAEDVREVRPEFYMYAIGEPGESLPVPETSERTWGIGAVRAIESGLTGRSIKVAVLDTGFDFDHPDFSSRTIQQKSFVPNETAHDMQGHGTHCIGTATGSVSDSGARYGVAPEAEIYVGKVLNNQGSGRESWIIAGMSWAVQNRCEIISMSLGRAVAVGEPADPVYENAGQTALDNGCLIIAAAGNESSRQYNYIAPVGAPANSPSIMAVAAIDANLKTASFSCGGINSGGGEVNIAGPGVDIFSSFLVPRRYRRLSGTSMAAPHIAGLGALWAEATGERGRDLWRRLEGHARNIDLSEQDAGSGLGQAPDPQSSTA